MKSANEIKLEQQKKQEFRVIVVVGFVLLIVGLFVLALWFIRYVPDTSSITDAVEIAKIRANYIDLIVKTFGGLAVIIALFLTFKRIRLIEESNRIAQEGQVTDRFAKAIELIGKESTEEKIGGIVALGRIARDSETDFYSILDILIVYICHNSKIDVNLDDLIDGDSDLQEKSIVVNADVKIALATIFEAIESADRLFNEFEVSLKYFDVQLSDVFLLNICNVANKNIQLLLNGSVFESVSIRIPKFSWLIEECYFNRLVAASVHIVEGANIFRCKFNKSDFTRSIFASSRIIATKFDACTLFETDFKKVLLENVYFSHESNLNSLKINDGKISRCDFVDSDMHVARFRNTRVSDSTFLGMTFVKATFENVIFEKVTFEKCDLAGTDFTKAQFDKHCKFVDLHNWERAKWSDEMRIHLENLFSET